MKGGRCKKMNDTKQENLDIGIGDKEPEKLKPAEVTIAGILVRKVGEKGNKKVVFSCIHPDKPDTPFEISSVKYETQPDKLKTIATWYNLEKKTNEDDPEKLQKSLAVAHIMRFLKVDTLKELEGKKIMTITDESGYLTIKGY